MSIDQIWTIFMPLTFGFAGYALYMKWRSHNRKISIIDGFLGWMILVVSAFIGEFLAHTIRPETYSGIGDNPYMVVGLMTVIMLSFILCPLLWWSLRKRSK